MGILYRWMHATVNPYSCRVDVCVRGILGRLAFFSTLDDAPPPRYRGVHCGGWHLFSFAEYPAACCGELHQGFCGSFDLKIRCPVDSEQGRHVGGYRRSFCARCR